MRRLSLIESERLLEEGVHYKLKFDGKSLFYVLGKTSKILSKVFDFTTEY